MKTKCDELLEKICLENNFKIVHKNIDDATEEEYQKIRMDWFGASDSSKLLDVNPFPNGSFKDLIMEKVTETVDKSIGKKASVRMGKDIEDIILNKVKELLLKNFTDEVLIEKPTDMYGFEKHSLGINFDAVMVYTKILLAIPIEIKAVTKYGRKYYDFSKAMIKQKDGIWQEVDKNNTQVINEEQDYETIAHKIGIPVYYYTQVQQQLLALNSDFGYLAVMDVDNWDVNIFFVPQNKKLQKDILNKSLLATYQRNKLRTKGKEEL